MHVEVGQIVYVLDSKRHALVPCQVNEMVVSKTLKGENIHHVLFFPNSKQMVLENLKTPWFTDLNGAKAHLLQEAESMIDSVVENARTVAADSFDVMHDSIDSPHPVPTAPPPAQLESSEMTVDLGDGVIGKVTLPKEFLSESSIG